MTRPREAAEAFAYLEAWLAGMPGFVPTDRLRFPGPDVTVEGLDQHALIEAHRREHPILWANVDATGLVVVPNSPAANSAGGSWFDSGTSTIHLSPVSLEAQPPDVFLRLVVHEIGHALFEPALLGVTTPTHDRWGGDGGATPARGRRGDDGGTAPAHGWSGGDGGTRFGGLPPDAQAFYSAWLILREPDGAHLCGRDFGRNVHGNRIRVAHRRIYQARSFSEFCAELFMQWVFGDLYRHLAGRTEQNTRPEVMAAWRAVVVILERYAEPICNARPRTGR